MAVKRSPDHASAPAPPSSSASVALARRVTLRDIAEAVGVTPMTVSRALRNRPRISAAMREKIQAKALEMGYQPDPALTALVHYRHNRLEAPVRAGLAWLNFWPDPTRWRQFREFALYWEGAEAAAKREGFHLEEFIVNEAMTPKRMAQILYTRNVRGILLPPGGYPPGWAEEFPWQQFSVVSISRTDLPLHVISSDQTSNTMLALAKLQERGYRRIGFVGEAWIMRTFGAGFLWAQAMNVAASERVPPLFESSDDIKAFQEAFSTWVVKNKPDAILTEIPFIPDWLNAMGLRVPQDIGLAAMTVLDCPIDAGINQNPREIGRVAVLMLHSLINDNDRGIPAISRQVLIKGSWVDGASLPKLT